VDHAQPLDGRRQRRRPDHPALPGVLALVRTTKPTHLLDHPDPVGPANEYAIRAMLEAAPLIVVGWGASLPELVGFGLEPMDQRVIEWAAAAGRSLTCLGTTKSGQPKHPLYVANSTERVPWSPAPGAL
jgi:hypothetical protein